MHFKIYQPHPYVNHIVDYYWHTYADLTSSIVQEVPTPILQGMTINLTGRKEQMRFLDSGQDQSMKSPIYIFGQSLSPRLSVSSEEGIDIIGVKFTSLGFRLLSKMNMQHLTDKIINAEDVWGKEVIYLCEALYDAPDIRQAIQRLDVYFFNKMCSGKQSYINPCVAEALECIHQSRGNIKIKTLQKQMHISQSTLERTFLDQLGMSPKVYARLLRYNQAKSLVDAGQHDWQDICFDLGYFDQSHFIKEFKLYSGYTPETYLEKNKVLENVF